MSRHSRGSAQVITSQMSVAEMGVAKEVLSETCESQSANRYAIPQQRIGYARVGTIDQTLAQQRDALDKPRVLSSALSDRPASACRSSRMPTYEGRAPMVVTAIPWSSGQVRPANHIDDRIPDSPVARRCVTQEFVNILDAQRVTRVRPPSSLRVPSLRSRRARPIERLRR
jgi:hypothetical protein